MALNPRQKKFILEYLQCWNASEAARRAGYSEQTAYAIGAENLRKPEVRAEIERRLAESAMSAGEVLARLTDHARSSMVDFLQVEGDEDGSIAVPNLSQAKERGRLHLLKKFKVGKAGDIAFELYDAQKALITLARIHGLLHERQDDRETDENDDAPDDLCPGDFEAEAALAKER